VTGLIDHPWSCTLSPDRAYARSGRPSGRSESGNRVSESVGGRVHLLLCGALVVVNRLGGIPSGDKSRPRAAVRPASVSAAASSTLTARPVLSMTATMNWSSATLQ
jgi:hypothetical protein